MPGLMQPGRRPLYAEAREAGVGEFLADCGEYLAELDKEERIAKYTLASLEEEEQSLDRLAGWYRELRGRDGLGQRGDQGCRRC